MRIGIRACLVVALLGAAAAAAAVPGASAASAAAGAPVRSVEGIDEYRLDNGLTLVLFPDASRPVTTVNVTYRVGSRHENYGETGMAHLLEHLVFKGTPTHADIPGEMRRRGIRFNGTTWLDRTNYFASFASDPDTLAWLLALEADRMVNSRIAREDLDSEMTVVRNEMESGENNPLRALMQRMMSTAYAWHNYGNATIGARSDVEGVPIERLQAFYRTWYQPDNAVLVIAGDFDPAHAREVVAATFGQLSRPARALPATWTREPAQDGERHVVVRRIGNTPYLGAGYHVPAARHDDAAALAVLAQVLGNTPSGRLHRALVEGGRATGVSAVHYSMDEPGYLMFLAEAPADADLDALQRELLALLEDAAATPFTEAEVDVARQRLVTGQRLAMRDPNAVGVALSEAIAQGDWRLFLLARDRLETVTADDVARVAATYLRRDNRTSGRFLPSDSVERTAIAEAPSAEALLQDYRGREAVAAGEAFDPSPANIDARTRTWTLDNGTRVAVLDKSTRGQAVQLRMTLRLGDETTLHGEADAGSMAASMLMRGAGGLDRAAISQRLVALQSSLQITGGASNVTVAATTDRDNLAALLDLVATLLQAPTFPESEFEQLRTQAITGVRSSMTEPGTVAGQAMRRHFDRWPPGHPYHVAGFEDQLAVLQALDLDAVRGFHRRFYGMGDGATIALVGDVDAGAVRAQLDTLFGDWNRPTPFARIPQPYHAAAAVRLRLETPDRPNAVLLARQSLRIDQDHPDYAALVLGNHILGGGGMKSRLADRIRQRDGLSYSVSSSFDASALDDAGSFSAYAIAAPENMAKVEAAFREELQRLLDDGIGEEELRDALDGMLRARRTGRANDAELVAQISGNLYLGRTLAYSAEFEDRLRALTPETVQAAMARHLDPAAISVFIGGDFGGKDADAAD
ncbi:insulinase family protein [Luteimonas sp. BDR2-5]|uniref:M16 family metallopeptidase n=1 Tax=Proluteimonas luteida TaxID=2878685 RepID=UPI001E37A938|nr:pitrilysin family protein [Luteimonas sp. BDR2-5]MCD9029061.1 insulinase family protein [Luteimonas sp. BDR2-5]